MNLIANRVKANCEEKTQTFVTYKKAVEQCVQLIGCQTTVDDLVTGQKLMLAMSNACPVASTQQ